MQFFDKNGPVVSRKREVFYMLYVNNLGPRSYNGFDLEYSHTFTQ